MPDFSVYGLFDPRDGQLRYVGLHQGRLQKRLNEHLCKARKGVKLYVYDWMRSVLKEGLEPEIEILQTCDSIEEMRESETWQWLTARIA